MLKPGYVAWPTRITVATINTTVAAISTQVAHRSLFAILALTRTFASSVLALARYWKMKRASHLFDAAHISLSFALCGKGGLIMRLEAYRSLGVSSRTSPRPIHRRRCGLATHWQGRVTAVIVK